MSLFKSTEEDRCGLKVLAYGSTGVGKTCFSLTFPDIAALDSEAGMSFYKKNPNLKYILNTTSAEEVEEALDEIENELIDNIKTFVVDSETKIYENLQLSGLNIAERRARIKGQLVDDAGLSQREWGKIKLITKRIQSAKITLSSKGVNIVSIAQEKEIKEKKGDNWVTVGYAPDVSKGFEYDYDIVLRLFTQKDPSSNTELYKAEVLKDRTGVTKKGEIIENPSFKVWEEVYKEQMNKDINVIDYKKDIEKDEEKMASELESLNEVKKELKERLKGVDKATQEKFLQECKSKNISNPLKSSSIDDIKYLIDFLDAISD